MRCQRDLRELKKADALTLISQMETRPQHRRLVAGTRPATTLSPVAYITTDFIGLQNTVAKEKHQRTDDGTG
jgi:hypothetical protein